MVDKDILEKAITVSELQSQLQHLPMDAKVLYFAYDYYPITGVGYYDGTENTVDLE